MLRPRLIGALTITVLLAGCASSGTVYTPRPFPMPGDKPATTTPTPTTPTTSPTTPATSPTTPTTSPTTPATSPTTAAPPSTPGRPVPRGSAGGYALSSIALSLRGAPYRNGGVDPNGFDCSGFVRYVFGQNGVALPREVREQFRVGKGVNRDRLEPGDLVFFSTVAPGASHVGIVIGGDQFVHAPSEKGVVRVEQLSTRYWASRFVGAKRVI